MSPPPETGLRDFAAIQSRFFLPCVVNKCWPSLLLLLLYLIARTFVAILQFFTSALLSEAGDSNVVRDFVATAPTDVAGIGSSLKCGACLP